MKNKTIIIIMSIVITSLLGFMLYTSILMPTLQDYILNKQIDAQNQVVYEILLQIQNNGYVQIPIGNESLILVPYQEPIQ